MKCDYCDLQATYSMGVVTDKGHIPIWACDTHKFIGAYKQDDILSLEELRSQLRNWGSKLINP